MPVMPTCISDPLTTRVLGSPGSEWMPRSALFGPCSRRLSLALQPVSGFRIELNLSLLTTHVIGAPVCKWLLGELQLDPTHDTYPRLSRQLVASVVSYIWTQLTMPVLGSPEGTWIPWQGAFGPCS